MGERYCVVRIKIQHLVECKGQGREFQRAEPEDQWPINKDRNLLYLGEEGEGSVSEAAEEPRQNNHLTWGALI